MKYQIVKIQKNNQYCERCHINLINRGINTQINFIYKNRRINHPTYWDELCECNNCHYQFYLRHDIFDEEGHIYSSIFTEDINNPEYSWMNILTDNQKVKIAEHVEKCDTCKKALIEEHLIDASFKAFITHLRRN